jgi:hypothetical protein
MWFFQLDLIFNYQRMSKRMAKSPVTTTPSYPPASLQGAEPQPGSSRPKSRNGTTAAHGAIADDKARQELLRELDLLEAELAKVDAAWDHIEGTTEELRQLLNERRSNKLTKP